MKHHLIYISAVAVAALSVSVLLTSCENTDYPDPVVSTTPSTNQARFLFVNVAPDAPALNFLIENTSVGQSLAFGQATTAYVPSQVGAVQLRAKAASGTIGGVIGSNDILFRAGATNETNFAGVAGGTYTVFVTDTLNRPKPTTANGTNLGGPQLLVVSDPLTQTLTAGAGGVRFFHFVPDVGLPANSTATAPSVVTVRLSVPTSTTGLPATVASFVNRAYRNVATTAFTSVPAGTYQVDVFAQAALPTSATTTAISSSTLTVAASKLYTLYAQGLARRTVNVGRIVHN